MSCEHFSLGNFHDFSEEEEEEGAKKMMTAYAALLLDSLQQYEDSFLESINMLRSVTGAIFS